MFSQYFGHYLLNNGLITSEQLKTALELQKTTHVKFGVIAVDESMLTSTQVQEIHDKQKQLDKRFGEIAVELGYLTDDQVEQMLAVQKNNHLLLAQAVVDQNYMTIDEFSQALKEYKKLYSLSDDQFEAIKNGDIDVMVEGLLNLDESDKEEYAHYLSLFVKNMIRFIDDEVYVEQRSTVGGVQAEWVVTQEIKGEKPLFTAIAAKEDVFLKIASVYAEEELTKVDDLAKASVSEFLNLHNGIYLVNMSNKGIELNMEPQRVDRNVVVSVDEDAYLTVNVHTSMGEFQLVISNQPKDAAVSCSEKEEQAV